MTQEIERKFLVDPSDLPEDLREADAKRIVQGYVALEEAGTEVRLRHKGARYFLTVKSGGGLTREEGEIEIDREQFDTLWPFTLRRRVEKIRHALPWGDELIELDVYEGALEGLATAEIEFPSEEASRRFEPPSWFGEEQTTNPRFKNKHLAIHGLPHQNNPEK